MDPIRQDPDSGDWVATDSRGVEWGYSDGLWRERAEHGATFPADSFISYAESDANLGDHVARLRFMMLGLAEAEPRNLCVGCGEDLGDSNPRQLCRKTWCPES